MHTERYGLLKASVLRNPLFAPPLVGSAREEHIPLTPIDQLARGRSGDPALRSIQYHDGRGVDSETTVLGMLTQPAPGLWFIEDEGKGVALDLTHCTDLIAGYYTETCVVIISGRYDPDGSPPASGAASLSSSAAVTAVASAGLHGHHLPGVFRATTMSHPPLEGREASLRAMGLVDPLRVYTSPGDLSRAQQLMREVPPAACAIVVMAHVHLDKPIVLDRLRRVLLGYGAADVVPAAFVLIGEFSSTAFGQHAGDRATFQRHFESLASLLCEPGVREVAQRTDFVLVPGARDPGGGAGVLPRPPIPASFAGRLADRDVIPRLHLASNPCRLRYYGHEIVVYRGDATLALRRRAVVPPNTSAEPSEPVHAAHTLLHQAHLCPLPLSVQPVYWAHDHALRLFPAPHALVVAEESEPSYRTKISSSDGGRSRTVVFNPGRLSADGGPPGMPGSEPVFSVYYPAAGEVEEASPDAGALDGLLDGEGGAGAGGGVESLSQAVRANTYAARVADGDLGGFGDGDVGNFDEFDDAPYADAAQDIGDGGALLGVGAGDMYGGDDDGLVPRPASPAEDDVDDAMGGAADDDGLGVRSSLRRGSQGSMPRRRARFSDALTGEGGGDAADDAGDSDDVKRTVYRFEPAGEASEDDAGDVDGAGQPLTDGAAVTGGGDDSDNEDEDDGTEVDPWTQGTLDDVEDVSEAAAVRDSTAHSGARDDGEDFDDIENDE